MNTRGIATGFPDGTFAPNNPATIAEFLRMTIHLADVRIYADVQGTHWARNYIWFAYDNRLFENVLPAGNSFDDAVILSDEPISREFAFYVLYRVFSGHAASTVGHRLVSSPQGEVLNFNDADDISADAFREAVNALSQVGVVTGRPNLTLAPNSEITRAEVTAILFRMVTPVGSVATFRYLPVDLTAGFEVLDPTGITVTPGVPATRYGDTFGAFGTTQYTFTAPATGLFAFRTANADTDSGANADASDTANAGFSPSVFLLTEIYGNDRYYDFERVRPEFDGTGIFLLEEGALFAVEAMGIPSQTFDIITMQVSDYIPNNVGLLHWPLDSMQVTMWYGQLDRLSPVISPGLNIQCDSPSEV